MTGQPRPTGSAYGPTSRRAGPWAPDGDVSDDDPVAPGLVVRALTAGELVFADGATQAFDADGGTTYRERGRETRGRWYVDDEGDFGSSWPGGYRARYHLRWLVEGGVVVGLRFIESGRGTRFDGRYRLTPQDDERPWR